jgi:hypothetical protein
MRHGTTSEITKAVALLAVTALSGVLHAQTPLPTTRKDFYMYGSQPVTPDEVNFEFLRESEVCAACHGDELGSWPEAQSPYERWRYTMMSQAARDPVFHAAFQVAQKDVDNAGEFCLRCHAPMGWFQNRANADGSTLDPLDYEGVSCSICHRAVDPDYKPGISPSVDEEVLAALGIDRPPSTGQGGELANGHLVIDPHDRRRGPYDLGEFFFHEFLQSNLHVSSDMCAACHDVSNPAYTRVGTTTTYTAGSLDSNHPTGNKYAMFPVERLYSEWKQSAFATGAITQTIPDGLGGEVGRFGGFQVTSYSTCQDCHMPSIQGTGCAPFFGRPIRDDLPQHNFSGVNSWVLRSVNDLFPPEESHMVDPAMLTASIDRNVTMLQRASDTELKVIGNKLRVRVINEGGHKLPSGYAEGRRIWVNVKFFNAANTLIAERGAYNSATAELSTADTKVYEQKQGLDAAAAALSGRPEGEGFHFSLNNKIYKDNRIPPRGFTNAAFAAVQSEPVAYTYADGQHWDDTLYVIPAGTASAQVSVFHQTSTKEYIEFLRDNATDPILPGHIIQPPEGSSASTLGELVHEQWVRWGRSAPVLMDNAATPARACKPDLGQAGGLLGADGSLDNNDFIVFIDLFFTQSTLADFGAAGGVEGSDGLFDNNDFIVFIDTFFDACP